MKSIPIIDINIPDNRTRTEFPESDHRELMESISTALLHPIVLENDGKTLCAGERRLRAIHALYESDENFRLSHDDTTVNRGEIPYVLLADLPKDTVRQLELEENLKRRNLSWAEQVAAIREFHDLKTNQHGEYSKATKKGWSVKDTATLLAGKEAKGSAISKVSEALTLANHLENPLVSSAPDANTAKRIIKREATQRKITKNLATKGATSTTSLIPPIFHPCAYQDAPALPPIDVFLMDPPYGIGADSFAHDPSLPREYDDDPAAWEAAIRELASFCAQVAAPSAHLMMFLPWEYQEKAWLAFFDTGWRPRKRPLIWDKKNTGSLSDQARSPRFTYETIFFAWRGARDLSHVAGDVFSYSNVNTGRLHPDQKPDELYSALLRMACHPGDTVLDPFAGSGTIFRACPPGVQAIGCENSPTYIEHCAREAAQR